MCLIMATHPTLLGVLCWSVKSVGCYCCTCTEGYCYCATVVCRQGDIRLRGGVNSSSGRVELCSENTWGTVCHGSWDGSEAMVVCKQLGFVAQGKEFALVAQCSQHNPKLLFP